MVRFAPFQKIQGPIDFAYENPYQSWWKATGAVNGHGSCWQPSQDRDQAEIITNPNSLVRMTANMVKTSKARNKIRQFF